jgi:hypothetical protein
MGIQLFFSFRAVHRSTVRLLVGRPNFLSDAAVMPHRELLVGRRHSVECGEMGVTGSSPLGVAVGGHGVMARFLGVFGVQSGLAVFAVVPCLAGGVRLVVTLVVGEAGLGGGDIYGVLKFASFLWREEAGFFCGAT